MSQWRCINVVRDSYLALGSNQGDRLAQMRRALLSVRRAAVRVLQVSPVYRNRAVGMGDADDFYNAVARVETALPPEALLGAACGWKHNWGSSAQRRWLGAAR